MISYADVYAITSVEDGNVSVGDVVVTGPCDHPRFKVIFLFDGRAWIRSQDRDEDTIVEQRRLRRLDVS